MLNSSPEEVSQAEKDWEEAVLSAKRAHAIAYESLRAKGKSQGDAEELAVLDEGYFTARMHEIACKAVYRKKSEEMINSRTLAKLAHVGI